MRRLTWWIWVVSLCAIALTAVAAGTQLRGAAATLSETDASKSAVASNTAFATDLYQVLLKEDAGNNIFISPYSITTILGLTTSGARGQTAVEMKRLLHVSDLDAMNAGISEISGQLSDTENGNRPYQLYVANALWGDHRYPVVPAFQQLGQKYYGTDGIHFLDFFNNSEASRATINKWVEDQTQTRIKDLMPQGSVTPLTAMVLTNAIYFKGAWEQKFNARLTTTQPFHAAAGRNPSVPLMSLGGTLPYFENDDIQAVSLTYQATRRVTPQVVSMLVILPKKTDGLVDIERKITPDNINQWIAGLQRKTGRVLLPKFNITSPTKLTSMLRNMGMSTAFNATQADFRNLVTPMQGDNVYISDVFHKAFINVDEDGTEAAAATAVAMAEGSAAPQNLFTFRADHPFFFVIRYEPTNSILFMGHFVSPATN